MPYFDNNNNHNSTKEFVSTFSICRRLTPRRLKKTHIKKFITGNYKIRHFTFNNLILRDTPCRKIQTKLTNRRE